MAINLGPDIYRRERLLATLQQFTQTQGRLLVVAAPAGYGKTVLLADFAQSTPWPVCWCTLQAADREPSVCLTRLIGGLAERFYDFEPEPLLQLLEQQDIEGCTGHLAEQLAHQAGPQLLIFDDYHLAEGPGLNLLFRSLLSQLPTTSRLIVVGRLGPDGELVARADSCLSRAELRFTAAELQGVMLKRFGRRVDRTGAEEMVRATEGNIARLLLSAHLSPVALQQRLAGADRRLMYDCLLEENFLRQSPARQRFMLGTVLLAEITVEVANELLEITDARQHIEALVGQDLLLPTGTGFRYPDLAADFLHARWDRQEPEQLRTLRLRAAELLAGQHRLQEALKLYISAAAWEEVATLLEKMEGALVGCRATSEAWHSWVLELSPAELKIPRLLLLQGQILLEQERFEAAVDRFQQAHQQYVEQGSVIGTLQTRAWRAVVRHKMGHSQAGLQVMDKVLPGLEALAGDSLVLGWALRQRGLMWMAMGRSREARESFTRALALFEQNEDRYQCGQGHQDLGDCLVKQGRLARAQDHYRQAIGIWQSLDQQASLPGTLNRLGNLLCTIGCYDEALEQFDRSQAVARQLNEMAAVTAAQVGLADVYLGRGETERARGAYQTVLSQVAGTDSALEAEILVKLAHCFYPSDLEQALKLVHQAEELFAGPQQLAYGLHGRIYCRYQDYERSFRLLARAFNRAGARLDQIKIKLWWGYSLLLDLRPVAALKQLQAAINLLPAGEDLLPALRPLVPEIKPLLVHFRHHPDTPAGVRDGIEMLLGPEPADGFNLQVFAFGLPALVVGPEMVRFKRTRTQRRLPEFLLYLLLEGGKDGCYREKVCAALWPEASCEQAFNLFHNTLKALKESLPPGAYLLSPEEGYYQLNPNLLGWCDALAFEKLYSRSQRSDDPDDRLKLWLELIDLYRGEFLAESELEAWGCQQRYRYETLFLQVVELAGRQLLEEGRAREGLDVLGRGLAVDYYRELLHQYTLQAYEQLGLYEDLNNHYQKVVRDFRRELGIEPDFSKGSGGRNGYSL